MNTRSYILFSIRVAFGLLASLATLIPVVGSNVDLWPVSVSYIFIHLVFLISDDADFNKQGSQYAIDHVFTAVLLGSGAINLLIMAPIVLMLTLHASLVFSKNALYLSTFLNLAAVFNLTFSLDFSKNDAVVELASMATMLIVLPILYWIAIERKKTHDLAALNTIKQNSQATRDMFMHTRQNLSAAISTIRMTSLSGMSSSAVDSIDHLNMSVQQIYEQFVIDENLFKRTEGVTHAADFDLHAYIADLRSLHCSLGEQQHTLIQFKLFCSPVPQFIKVDGFFLTASLDYFLFSMMSKLTKFDQLWVSIEANALDDSEELLIKANYPTQKNSKQQSEIEHLCSSLNNALESINGRATLPVTVNNNELITIAVPFTKSHERISHKKIVATVLHIHFDEEFTQLPIHLYPSANLIRQHIDVAKTYIDLDDLVSRNPSVSTIIFEGCNLTASLLDHYLDDTYAFASRHDINLAMLIDSDGIYQAESFALHGGFTLMRKNTLSYDFDFLLRISSSLDKRYERQSLVVSAPEFELHPEDEFDLTDYLDTKGFPLPGSDEHTAYMGAIDQFKEEAMRDIKIMELAILENDPKRFRYHAHHLKNWAGFYRLTPLSDATEDLQMLVDEDLGRPTDTLSEKGASELLADAINIYQNSFKALLQMLNLDK